MSITVGNPDEDPMTAEHQVPDAIAALTILSGVPEEDIAVQVASVFTAIGGPHAGLVTLGDEFQSVGFHLLHLGGDSARQRRLIDLLLRPLRFVQEDLLEYSRLAPSEQLDWMGKAFVRDKRSDEYLPFDPSEERVEGAAREDVFYLADLSSQATSLSSPWRRQKDVDLFMDEIGCNTLLPVDGIHRHLPGYPMLSQSYVGRNEGRCLYDPIVFFDNPAVEALQMPWKGVDRNSPLILDETGKLWEEACQSKVGRKLLASLLKERAFVDPSASSKERHRSGQAQLLSVVTEKLGRRLLSEPELESCLSTTLLAGSPLPRNQQDGEINPEQIANGCEHYRRTIEELVRFRRLDALALWGKKMNAKVAVEFHLRQSEFVAKLETVDADERPFTAELSNLLTSLVWTLSQLSPEREITSDQVSLAMTWAEAAMRNHLRTLREFKRDAEAEQIERKAAEMLWKLHEVEPATFRDLMRKYPVQRRDVHEPVLNHLVESGKVLRMEDNKFRLTDDVRAELIAPSAEAKLLA